MVTALVDDVGAVHSTYIRLHMTKEVQLPFLAAVGAWAYVVHIKTLKTSGRKKIEIEIQVDFKSLDFNYLVHADAFYQDKYCGKTSMCVGTTDNTDYGQSQF